MFSHIYVVHLSCRAFESLSSHARSSAFAATILLPLLLSSKMSPFRFQVGTFLSADPTQNTPPSSLRSPSLGLCVALFRHWHLVRRATWVPCTPLTFSGPVDSSLSVPPDPRTPFEKAKQGACLAVIQICISQHERKTELSLKMPLQIVTVYCLPC